MKRRELLRLLAAAPLAGASARLLATPAARDARLLVVFLRGAYDCANLLVPTASDFYRVARPRIAVPRPGEALGALALDADWACIRRWRRACCRCSGNDRRPSSRSPAPTT